MQSKFKRCLSLGLVLGVLLCLFSAKRASGQMDQGTVTGVIQDSSGAVIPDAQITLTNNDNGLALNTKSDKSGIYVFSPVKIGNYTVTASAPGFKTTSQEHVVLNVGPVSYTHLDVYKRQHLH